MPRSFHQLANLDCWVVLWCLEVLTRKYFSSFSFLKLYSWLWMALRTLVFVDVTMFAIVNWWWKSKIFTHSQSLCIIFSFALVRAWLLAYIGIIHLHTFCDAKKFLIYTSCNISHNHTRENIQRQTKAMISQRFPLRSWRMISRTLHLFLVCSKNVTLVNWRLTQRKMGKPHKHTNRHISQLLPRKCSCKLCHYLRWVPKFLIEPLSRFHFYKIGNLLKKLTWCSQWVRRVSCSPEY